jgi:tetratricopeptide (TPR) repeat protein
MEHGADRDNFRRAWDYALEQGLAAEAADLGRGIAYLDVNQGSEAVAMLPEARENLLKSGVQETDRALLYLGLTEVWLHSGIDSFEMHEARTMAFLSQIEKTGESEICLWTYLQWADRMGMEGRIELIGWLEKAVKVAQELNDEILAKFAEGKSMSWRVAFGLEEAETVSNLQALLAYFETDFGSSYADFVILWALCRLHRKKGQLAQMLSYGQRALNIAKHWQDLLYISQGYYVLTVNFLDMGLTHEAALQQLEALDWHLAIGQVWQSLGLIMGFCLGWPQFVGGPASAVTTLSMIYHHPENIPYNKERIAENRNRMEAELGNAAFVEAWERGKKLDFKTAVTQVRAALAAVE